MRILMVGAGAVGGYYGGRLVAAGRDVTFLVRGKRAEQLRRDGIRIVSPYGDLQTPVKAVTASELKQRKDTFDLVMISVKAYALEAAIDDIAPAVGGGTVVLPLLNGLKHLDVLDERFGAANVIGGMTRIVSDASDDGVITQMDKMQDVFYGERNRSVTPRIQAIDAALSGAGFEAILSPDVLGIMWQKWTFLAALGAITCLMRGSIGDVQAAAGGPEFAEALVRECEAIAAANGYPQEPKTFAMMRSRLLQAGSPLTASMFRDLQKGAAVEAGHIIGDMIRRGQKHGVHAPLLNAAFVALNVYSAHRDNK